MLRILLIAVLVAFAPTNTYAVNPDEILADPVLEARARDISKGLRCLVCQNQSIDDSDASLAKDLRVLVRERLTAGDSNEDVVNYVVSRYGDFVLLKPPFNMGTLVLWLGPFLLVLIGLFAVVLFYKRSRTEVALPNAAPKPLSKAEQDRLEKILEGTDP